MRYPGHAERMRALRESGFFDETAIDVGGAMVTPGDVTSTLLFRSWQLEDGEADLTAMRVIVEGTKHGRRVRYTYEMLDRYDAATGITSMARTTGFTCTAAVRLVASGALRFPGIVPPERIGADEASYRAIMADLRARGVVFSETID